MPCTHNLKTDSFFMGSILLLASTVAYAEKSTGVITDASSPLERVRLLR